MALDKVEKPNGELVADDAYRRGAAAFFKGLHHFVREVNDAAKARDSNDENPAAGSL